MKTRQTTNFAEFKEGGKVKRKPLFSLRNLAALDLVACLRNMAGTHKCGGKIEVVRVSDKGMRSNRDYYECQKCAAWRIGDLPRGSFAGAHA